jgi:4-hydroxy-tetrahydrodipicolinate synthase
MGGNWSGLFPALWTPTDAAGKILRHELTAQVHFLQEAGADGLMVLGSTGEFVYLDVPTRREALRVAIQAAGDTPVIANCSDVNPRFVADLGRFSREVGARAISLLPPWFYPLPPADIAEFMIRGAEAAGLPLMLYNFPERTGHRLDLETVAMVCDRVPVVALKQSGTEFAYHRELAELARDRGFVLITGADTRIADAFALGARGVVSGLANAVPEWVIAVFRAAQKGDPKLAAVERLRLQSLAACVAGLDFPLDVAAAMRARGRPIGDFKPVLSAPTLARFHQAVSEAMAVLR